MHNQAAPGAAEPHNDRLDLNPDVAAAAQEEQPDLNPDTITTTPIDLAASAAMSISGNSRQRKCDFICLYIYPSIPNVCIGSVSNTSMASMPDPIPDVRGDIGSCFPAPGPSSVSIQPDAFKTKFHPKSGRPTTIDSFSTFDRSQNQPPNQHTGDDKSEPWHPFQTLEDFEFSEIAHQAALNKDQTNRLLALIQRVSKGEAKITLESHRDVSEAWKRAAKMMTPVNDFIRFYLDAN